MLNVGLHLFHEFLLPHLFLLHDIDVVMTLRYSVIIIIIIIGVLITRT